MRRRPSTATLSSSSAASDVYKRQVLYHALGSQQAALFMTGYFVEESLSMDNLVVFILIFKEFRTPSELQHVALLYAVLFSLGFRVLIIFGGTWLLSRFRIMFLFFGAFLVFTGAKMAAGSGGSEDIGAIRKSTMRALSYLGVECHSEWGSTGELKLQRREDGRWTASPMLPLFLSLGLCDALFSFDSIPATLGITEDVYLVVTSNVFAVLGIRSLYWCFAALHSRFSTIQHALSAALVCVGMKMAVGYLEWEFPGFAYAAIALVMGVSAFPGRVAAVRKALGLGKAVVQDVELNLESVGDEESPLMSPV
eukprot:TRINITY_DN34346_c0_g1_i1.p1 TRINITY_DN34346_c0_g1~~TRINITY_DN34346_c0_g1_i1.p1  ORF type:complete len:310 (-),score=78.53 TRINITY_DN34346_c0_g1_i1:21-950(-)